MTDSALAQTQRELAAELVVLEEFHARRSAAGHDYGGGQRRSEIWRRRRALDLEALRWSGLADSEFSAEELAAAFDRVGRPKIARIEREDYRRSTPSTQRTLRTWRSIERTYGSAS